jgi:hypothetical protein
MFRFTDFSLFVVSRAFGNGSVGGFRRRPPSIVAEQFAAILSAGYLAGARPERASGAKHLSDVIHGYEGRAS